MDPLTQGLLGASCGQALYGRILGRKAIVWGAAIGMSPDVDVVLNATGPMGEWLWHRGFTHSLWFGPVLGPVLGWLLWRWKGGRLRDWMGLAVAALFTHPLLDLFTSYGTQLLAPFSRRRFALDAVGIIDPAYSLLLAGALGVALWRGARSGAARRAAWLALGLSTTYLFLGLEVNRRAETLASDQLRAEGVQSPRVNAYPTLFQLPLRRVVARSGHEIRVGWVSLLAPEPITWARFEEARGPLVRAARHTWEAEVLEWFAMGQTRHGWSRRRREPRWRSTIFATACRGPRGTVSGACACTWILRDGRSVRASDSIVRQPRLLASSPRSCFV